MGRHVGSLTEGLRRKGIKVDLFDRSQRPFLWKIGKNIGFSLFLWRRIRQLVTDKTIVHAHAGPGGVFLVPPPGVPFLVTAHHTYLQQSKIPGQWWKRMLLPFEKRMYRRANRIACISEDTARCLRDFYRIPRKKISVVPCGFDLGSWEAADSDNRDRHACVFIGRPDRRKGWDLLQKAWGIIEKEFPDAVLHVVGWKESDRPGIQFHGRLSDRNLTFLVGRCRTALCPSRAEGFGLAAAEAIAAGTPVVATDTDGLRRIVSGATGLLVEPEPHAIADGIRTLLGDGTLWRRLHAGCRFERNRFGISKELDEYSGLYNALY